MEAEEDLTATGLIAGILGIIWLLIVINWMIEGYWGVVNGKESCTAFSQYADSHSQFFNVGNYLACRK